MIEVLPREVRAQLLFDRDLLVSRCHFSTRSVLTVGASLLLQVVRGLANRMVMLELLAYLGLVKNQLMYQRLRASLKLMGFDAPQEV
jgi:hypothetical protein